MYNLETVMKRILSLPLLNSQRDTLDGEYDSFILISNSDFQSNIKLVLPDSFGHELIIQQQCFMNVYSVLCGHNSCI